MPNPRRRLFQCLVLTFVSAAAIMAGLPGSAEAASQATVVTGSGPLRVRAAPTTASAVLRTASNGSTLPVTCSVTGQYVRGAVRATTQWDQLSTGGFVSHGYVSGGTIAACGSGASTTPSAGSGSGTSTSPSTSTPSGTVRGTVATGSGPLRVRSGPSTLSANAGSVANGATLAISCQVSGERIRGTQGTTTQWDRLSSGLYVSHAYLRTDPVPACPTGSSGSTPSTPSTTTYTGKVTSKDGPVRLRSGASTGSAVVGSAPNGSSLSISCAAPGTTIRGTVSTTSQWDRLTSGSYISHAYVTSGIVPACAGGTGTVTPEPSGTMTNAQFIAASVAPAQQTHRDYGVPASVTIAQAIIESGWGRSSLASQDHNFFGIKCSGGNRGAVAIGCRTYTTTECGTSCGLTTASFRVYASAADSFRDHALFLTGNSRYRSAFDASNNPDEFLRRIWRAGYATSPTYDTLVISIMQKYQLYQYDRI